jgi:Hypoxia induced protein conserved region
MGATALYYLSILATLAVAVVLVFGLSTLLKGNDANLSQRLMRWRIGLQFIAIVMIMVFVYLTRGFS